MEGAKKLQLVKLQTIYSGLDRQIDLLKDKSDRIGEMDGDQAAIRRKETEIEVSVF